MEHIPTSKGHSSALTENFGCENKRSSINIIMDLHYRTKRSRLGVLIDTSTTLEYHFTMVYNSRQSLIDPLYKNEEQCGRNHHH